MGAVFAQAGSSDAKVAAQRGFKGFKSRERQRVGKADIKEDLVLKQLKEAWERWKPEKNVFYDGYTVAVYTYEGIVSELAGLHWTSEDVERISLVPSGFDEIINSPKEAGLFLSALINIGSGSDYVIHTTYLEKVNVLGYKNCKNIVVRGDAGYLIGKDMVSGSIIVEGDVKDGIGRGMEGGSIIVRGNAERAAGSGMKGGSITIEGNAGEDVGNGSDGGDIIVKGNAGDYVGRLMHGGSIVVRGNAGKEVGAGMENGSITVKGNAGDDVGERMEGGSITIEGDIGRNVGTLMKGGKIIVKGNVGGWIGLVMYGGEIYIEGGFDSIGHIQSGKIFHKGVLIAGV